MKNSKRVILAVLIIGIVLGMIPTSTHAEVPQGKGKFAIGMDSIFPVTGLSGKYWFDDKLGGQVIVGLFGDLSMYGGRALYKFQEGENHYLYGSLLVGNWTYEWDFGWLGSGTESAFGLGLTGGLEYFSERIPSLGISLEIGFSSITLEHYDFSTVMAGTGIHYYF
ncbi:hypothetical protein E3J48_00685 [Candidatus Aerophobetes bacterium]|uniref:Outer membrane protein beta-barrel domain-containing protein n=1 Tax=Aerophobetes bacterium TaxID=2030807 RepID=A0A523WCI5_UNCAE|nr:MAG: hypothetical protein E3J48_00685 [Candidatus Aerophobetes bacterium]